MRIFRRGADVTITHTFYDSTGGITSPSSARLTISYPTTGFPYRGGMASTFVTMTQLSSSDANFPLGWQGVWNSIGSAPGTVFWSVRSDDLSDGVADGEFELRGNPANLSVVSTT